MKHIIFTCIALLCSSCSMLTGPKKHTPLNAHLLSPEEAALVQYTLPRAIIMPCAVTPQNTSMTNASFPQQSVLSPSNTSLQLPSSANTSFNGALSASSAKSPQASVTQDPLESPRDTDNDSLLGSKQSAFNKIKKSLGALVAKKQPFSIDY